MNIYIHILHRYIQCGNDPQFTINVTHSTTISQLKQLIFEKKGYTPRRQILELGQSLSSTTANGNRLSDFNIRPNRVIHFKLLRPSPQELQELEQKKNDDLNNELNHINESNIDSHIGKIKEEIKKNKIWGFAEMFSFDPNVLITIPDDEIIHIIPNDDLFQVQEY